MAIYGDERIANRGISTANTDYSSFTDSMIMSDQEVLREFHDFSFLTCTFNSAHYSS